MIFFLPNLFFSKKLIASFIDSSGDLRPSKNEELKNIEDYRLDFAINEVYEFFWGKFCDVYIEECKKSGETDNLRPMLKEILVMMHPFAPFITEEIHSLLFKSQIIE